jgi:hypothetical protein
MKLILCGEFVLQLHIGALMLAGMRGHLDLAALARPGARPLTSIKARLWNATNLASTNPLEPF